MGVGGVSGNQAQLDLQKLQQHQETNKANSTQALNQDVVSQEARMKNVREQMAAQSMQREAMMAFSPGAKGSHEANMSKLSPAHKELATNMTNQLMNGIRESVALRMVTSSAMTAGTNDATQQQDEVGGASSTEDKDKKTSSSGGTNGMGSNSSKMSMGSSASAGTSGNGSLDDAAVQGVMSGAMSGVYSQLYGIVNKMEGTRQNKASLSNIEAIYNQAIGTGQNPVKGVPQYDISFDAKTGKLSVQYMGTKDMTQAELTAAKQKVGDTKDSMSEMSTMDQMTLQQAMEQKGQFESVFSNMLKTYQSTASGVLANIKD